MKKLLFFCSAVLFFLFAPYSFYIDISFAENSSSWQKINSPVNSTIYEIYFIDDNTGFIGGEGCIYKTVNKGRTWYQVYSDNVVIKNISFYKGIGFATCFDAMNGHGKLLKTENEGEIWEENSLIHNNELVSLEMKNELEISIGSYDGYYFLSTDGGVSWSQTCILFPGVLICGMEEFNNKMFILNPGCLYKQDTSGYWQAIGPIGIFSYGDLVVDPSSNSLYAGGDNWPSDSAAISSTPDEGFKWEVELLGDKGAVKSLLFSKNSIDDSYAFGGAIINNVYYSCIWQRTNGVWRKVYTSPSEYYSGLIASCESNNYVYAAGGLGLLIMKEKSTATTLKKESPLKKVALQNYPNPFNPVTKIKYELPKNSMVTLKVFDISGREIITLVSQNQLRGTHEVEFDGSKLSSGAYFYKLIAGEFFQTKKMMLVK